MIFDASQPPAVSDVCPCTYRNVTTQIQLIRATTIGGPTIERMVCPAQVISFMAHPEDELEVYTHTYVTAILSERIACRQLITDNLNSQVGVVA